MSKSRRITITEASPATGIDRRTSVDSTYVSFEEERATNPLYDLQLKDSGYAWIVLAAMFVANILTVGYIKGFGIIYNAILDVYPDSSGTMAGIMMGLLAGCRSIFSPLTGSIAKWLGVRKTMCLGTSIYCIALLASFYCTSTAQLSITLGAMIGLSHCMIDSCQVILMPLYFESKLAFANGIRVAGNPCGGILYPIMLTSLLLSYNLRFLFVILTAITSHLYICAFLIRPIGIHCKIKAIDKVNNIFNDDPHHEEHIKLLNPKETLANGESQVRYNEGWTSEAKILYNESEEINFTQSNINHHPNIQLGHKMNLYNKIMDANTKIREREQKERLNFKFLRDPHYIFFIVMAIGIPMGLPLVLYYMTLYAKASVGLSPYEITVLVSTQAVFDFFLRIFIGWLNNKNLYDKSIGFMICLWCSAVGTVLIPIGRSLATLIAIVVLYSMGPASFHCFTTVILCEQFGRENIASTWGFVRMTQGIFSFVHPILIGYALDWSGAYTVPFLIMGLGLFVCGISIGAGAMLKKRNIRS